MSFFFFRIGPASKHAANSDDDEAETCFLFCSQQPSELFVVFFFLSLMQKIKFYTLLK